MLTEVECFESVVRNGLKLIHREPACVGILNCVKYCDHCVSEKLFSTSVNTENMGNCGSLCAEDMLTEIEFFDFVVSKGSKFVQTQPLW